MDGDLLIQESMTIENLYNNLLCIGENRKLRREERNVKLSAGNFLRTRMDYLERLHRHDIEINPRDGSGESKPVPKSE